MFQIKTFVCDGHRGPNPIVGKDKTQDQAINNWLCDNQEKIDSIVSVNIVQTQFCNDGQAIILVYKTKPH